MKDQSLPYNIQLRYLTLALHYTKMCLNL